MELTKLKPAPNKELPEGVCSESVRDELVVSNTLLRDRAENLLSCLSAPLVSRVMLKLDVERGVFSIDPCSISIRIVLESMDDAAPSLSL